MKANRWVLLTMVSLGLLLSACQQKRPTNRAGLARTNRGNVTSPGAYNTQWGEIRPSSAEEVYTFASASLSQDSPVALGPVTGQNGTGISFWGYVPVACQGGFFGQVNNTARLYMAVYDDKALQGESPMIVYIGADREGFQRAFGQVQGNVAQITFEDNFGQVTLQGTVNGTWFTGDVRYTNFATGSNVGVLGQFQVPAAGFFSCN